MVWSLLDHFYCLFTAPVKIPLSQNSGVGVANFVCRRPAFLLFALFKRIMPDRSERFWGQLPRLRHGSSSLRISYSTPCRISLSRPFFCLKAPCGLSKTFFRTFGKSRCVRRLCKEKSHPPALFKKPFLGILGLPLDDPGQ